jgi:hypothetical protein
MESWCPALKIMSGDIASSVRFVVFSSAIIVDVVDSIELLLAASIVLSLVDDSELVSIE